MNQKIQKVRTFFLDDIWRITKEDVTGIRFVIYNLLKMLTLAIRRFVEDKLLNKASALTYSTLLSLVPILALVFAIAKGFGFRNIIEAELRLGLEGQADTMETLLVLVDSYLQETKGGLFVGIGVVLLLWTVLNLISNIETTFNGIWEIKKNRSFYRRMTDYFSMLFLIPILFVISAGVTLFMATVIKQMPDFLILTPMTRFLVRSIPYILTCLTFTGLYIYMPNTKVAFRHAIIPGILAGSAFQLFQFIYINGQIGVSKYNAIYGSFAALPLLLLFLQVSWTICLFGAELTFAAQNIKNFSFEKDTQNISRRYRDFITVLIASLIAKRLKEGKTPYTAEEISLAHQIPTRLTHQVLHMLELTNIIKEVSLDEKEELMGYIPCVDINQLDLALLMDRLDTFGSEDFKIEVDSEYNKQWDTLINMRKELHGSSHNMLLVDL